MKRYVVPVALGALLGQLLVRLWLPLIMGGPAMAAPPTVPYVLPVPPGITLHATNPQMIRDSAGVIWAATRANSSIGGVVWRVDGYQDAAHPGVATYVINDPAHPDPRQYYGNGELMVWPDGYLYWIQTPVNSQNMPINQVAIPVPGFTP